MKSVIALALTAYLASGQPQDEGPMTLDEKFLRHMADYGITYETAEEFATRKAIFEETDTLILSQNLAIAQGSETCELGHNYFSTWTEDEFKAMLGLNPLAFSLDL